MSSSNVFDVCIVGGGLAGLSAADRLLTLQPSAKVVVLEARPRVGGRTHTITISSTGEVLHDGVSYRTASSIGRPSRASHDAISIDIGGQWVGPQHSETLELVRRFGLQLEEQIYAFDASAKTTASSQDDASEAQRLVEAVNYPHVQLSPADVAAIEQFLRLVADFGRSVDLAAPWAHPQAQQFDEVSLAQALDERVATAEARRQLSLFAQTVMACDPAQLSFLHFLWYVACGGGVDALGDGEQGAQKWKIVGGAQQLSVRLKEALEQRGAQVRLAVPVAAVHTDSDAGLTRVLWDSTADDAYVLARRVVLALSPQLLPDVDFRPPLPADKQRLCAAFLRPHVIKVFAVYSTQFWVKPSRAVGSLPHFATLGPVHNVFHAPCGPRLSALVGLITGAAAASFAKLPPAKRRQLVLQQYAAMYDDPVALQPECYHETDWGAEEYSGGCFASILPPGVLARLGHCLRPSIGPLHFCSTETAVDYSGYFEGAIRSGIRVAGELHAQLLTLARL